MKLNKFFSLLMMAVITIFSFTSCSSDDDNRDMTRPEISTAGIVAAPINCEVYKRGTVIPFRYIFTDNVELGSFTIEIHNNFDHHTHSTEEGAEEHHEHETDCTFDANKKPANPWYLNQSYTIPAGLTKYSASLDIPIPEDIEEGDYHFRIEVLDKAGWPKMLAVAIKIQ